LNFVHSEKLMANPQYTLSNKHTCPALIMFTSFRPSLDQSLPGLSVAAVCEVLQGRVGRISMVRAGDFAAGVELDHGEADIAQ
jgi:hypothetical protein